MNVDVSPWVTHGRDQSIFSVDIDKKGLKVATAGSDSKVKVWDLAPILSTAAEQDQSRYPRLLATLKDHSAPVNTVRFSASGRYLASCSDDKFGFIFELLPGAGKAAFGSSEQPNLENWKLQCHLRGHSNNVMDIAWSPEDVYVATCSLDNNIYIWSSSGKQVATLEGHSSYVKGVAWDPIGSYLASQSDDKSIIVWRCSDWTALKHISMPFQKGYISQTFSLRLSWTTDGQYLVGANSYQSPSHCACVLSRGEWDNALNVVGHKAAVTVVCFNPVLFKDSCGDPEPANCFALGSQDRRVTVWLSSGDRPLIIFNKVFTQSITDLAWSPDGHTLLATSTDGHLGVFRFEAGKLGEPIGSAGQQALMQQLYGGRPNAKVLLVESAAQLGLENAKAKSDQGTQNAPPLSTPGLNLTVPAEIPAGVAARLGPTGPRNGAAEGFGSGLAGGTTPAGAAVDTAVNAASQQPRDKRIDVLLSSRGKRTQANQERLGEQAAPRPARRLTAEPLGSPPATSKVQPLREGSQPAGTPGNLQHWSPMKAPKALSISLGKEDSLAGLTGAELKLEVVNSGNAAVASCLRDRAVLWRDTLNGNVVKACGNLHFSALALQSGLLQVYTPAGRRLYPSICLGHAARYLCAGSDWLLMAILQDGTVWLWNLRDQTLVVKASIAQLRNMEVVAARLTENGKPVVVLADGSAHMLHPGMQTWLCVVDPSFMASPFASTIPSTGQTAGELGTLEAEAAAAGSPALPTASQFLADTSNDRRHLESQLAAALALGSSREYRRWLLTYVYNLAGEGDEVALREVCRELLGPLRSSKSGPATWDRNVLGMDKRELLKEVLKELSKHRTQQRLLAEMLENLNVADASSYVT